MIWTVFQLFPRPIIALFGSGETAALSFAKLVVFLIPLILILSRFFGLDGVMYATPAADFLSFLMAVVFLADEMRNMPKEDMDKRDSGEGSAVFHQKND